MPHLYTSCLELLSRVAGTAAALENSFSTDVTSKQLRQQVAAGEPWTATLPLLLPVLNSSNLCSLERSLGGTSSVPGDCIPVDAQQARPSAVERQHSNFQGQSSGCRYVLDAKHPGTAILSSHFHWSCQL